MAPIYLDHNATTPLAPAVAEAMAEVWAGGPGNAASQHGFGRNARHMLETAREGIAELLGAKVSGMDADRLIFTSGGTEANHLALRGLAGTRGHLVTSSIEHPSVLITAEQLAKEGWLVDRLPADSQGVVQIDPLNDVLRLETRLVSLMFGNNETGVLQGVAEAARICEQRGVPLHTDAVQVVGKLPVHFRELGVAALSCTAHKFHGPQGIGALLVRHGIAIEPQMYGGFQQAGLRPGTEPVALAVGMHTALQQWHHERNERAARMAQLRDRFERQIVSGVRHAEVIGEHARRLPHTSNIAFVGRDRQALFMAIDLVGVACSTGSACASGSSEPSHVLVAMGCSEGAVRGSLRFSLGAFTTAAEVDEAAARIVKACNDLERRN
jgi:cysteine desulfurase